VALPALILRANRGREGSGDPRAGDSTETLPLPIIKPDKETAPDRGWKVLLYNDDVTPFDVVVFALQRAAGLSIEVAEMVAYEAHSQGEAVVKRGLTEEDAKTICGGLRAWTRVDGICPGVECEAVEDDA
jgi:ATP-dependent Clp protease adapter protein ClpS